MFPEMIIAAAMLQATSVPKNPTLVEFVCPDHGIDDNHEVEIRAKGAASGTIVKLGDPVARVSDGKVEINVGPLVQALVLGEYEVRVRALKSGSPSSDWSPELVPFERALAQPNSTRIVR